MSIRDKLKKFFDEEELDSISARDDDIWKPDHETDTKEVLHDVYGIKYGYMESLETGEPRILITLYDYDMDTPKSQLRGMFGLFERRGKGPHMKKYGAKKISFEFKDNTLRRRVMDDAFDTPLEKMVLWKIYLNVPNITELQKYPGDSLKVIVRNSRNIKEMLYAIAPKGPTFDDEGSVERSKEAFKTGK